MSIFSLFSQLLELPAKLLVAPRELRTDTEINGVQIEFVPTRAGLNLGETVAGLQVCPAHLVGRLPLPRQSSGPRFVELDLTTREPAAEQARLFPAKLRKAVVVLPAPGLPMPDEVDC